MRKIMGPWNAETIREARRKAKITQRDMADDLGCRQQTISEWELGVYAPANAYQKIITMYFNEKVNKND